MQDDQSRFVCVPIMLAPQPIDDMPYLPGAKNASKVYSKSGFQHNFR